MESVVIENIIKLSENSGVDRKKICPVLLRVFIGKNRHNALSEYSRGQTPTDELQIYTWIDASLKEIAGLIRAVHPESRRRGTTFQFAIVFADPLSRSYRTRDIGATTPGRPSLDDDITLASKRFQIGDFLDVAVGLDVGNSGGGMMSGMGGGGGMGLGGGGGFGGVGPMMRNRLGGRGRPY